MTTLPNLVQSHVFGLNAKVSNNVIYLDDQTIIYPSGTQMVFYEVDQKCQKFLSVNESDGMSTMATSASGKSLALAIKGPEPVEGEPEEKSAFIALYDLQTFKKKKVFALPHDVIIKEFVSVAFAKDGKFIFALSGAPDWTIYVWNIEKSRLQGSVKTTNMTNSLMSQISCNPYQSGYQLCLIGNGIMRLYKYADGTFKVLSQVKSDKNLTCHSWISANRLVAGTDDSRLLVFDSAELILEISYMLPSSNAHADVNSQITTVSAYSNGLVVGVSTGVAIIFEKTDDAYLYKKSKEFILEDTEVNSIAVNPTETMAIASLRNGQIYVLPVELDPSKGDVVRADRLIHSFHDGPILGMAVACHKPLIVTSGADKSIRVWNYLENTLEVCKYFPEVAQSISLHPSGLYILAGFSTSLKLMTLLIDDIRPYWETHIPNCRECQFSNGGQFFAAALGSTIQIYNTWTFAIVGTCRGSDSKIKSISWSRDDMKIVSCGIDGSNSTWDARSFKRETLVASEAQFLDSPCFGLDTKQSYSVGADGSIKQIIDGKIVKDVPQNGSLSFIVTANTCDLLFGATKRGFVRTLTYPLLGDSGGTNEFVDYGCHSAPVTRIRVSCDDQFLFSGGEDGLLWVFKIDDKLKRRREKDWIFSDDILVTKSDLSGNYKLMSDLKQRVEEIKSYNDAQQRLKDVAYAKKMSDSVDRFTVDINNLKENQLSLNREREQNLARHIQKMKDLKDAHSERLKASQQFFDEKMRAEANNHQEVRDKGAEIVANGKSHIRDIELLHIQRVQQLGEYYNEKYQEKQENLARIRLEIEDQKANYEAGVKEIEDDIDVEYTKIHYQYCIKLKKEQDGLKDIRTQNQNMKAEYESLQKQVEENKAEIAKMITDDKKQQHVIKSLEKDILGLKREIQEREDTLMEKEKRISDLRKKNQELEKFKFVLDFKIVELRNEIEPKEQDIIKLHSQLEEMNHERMGYTATEVNLKTLQNDFLMKEKAVANELDSFKKKRSELKDLTGAISRDALQLMNKRSKLKELKKLLVDVYHRYQDLNLDPSVVVSSTGGGSLKLSSVSKDQSAIVEASRATLECTQAMIVRQVDKSRFARYKEAVRFSSENAVLTNELNYLKAQLLSVERSINKYSTALSFGQKAISQNSVEYVKLDRNVSPGDYLVNELALPPINSSVADSLTLQ